MDLKRNRVENTNDSAVVSKYSMYRKGYVCDPFLQYFVSDKDQRRSRSPLINRFYCIRFKAIEYAFNRFNDFNEIVSIGSGFDTSFLRFPKTCFIEIDFPFVAINKAKILIDNQLIALNNNSVFKDGIKIAKNNEPFVVLRTDNYCLIGADLRKYNNVKQLFIEQNLMKNLNKESKVCLFNECSLCYLKQENSDNLIRMLTDLYEDKCHSITYLGFEHLRPNHSNDGFSKVMLNHFETIGSPLKTFLTKSETINRFKVGLNFESIQVLDMKTFFDEYIPDNEKQRINSIEMFDEYEEFDSVCSCYALTIAQSITDSKEEVSDHLFIDNNRQIEAKNIKIERNSLLLRFGHSSCLTSDHKIVVFGGFGSDFDANKCKTSHKRLSNFIEFNTKTDEIIAFNCNTNETKGIHSQIVELKDNLYLVSGGRLSPTSILGDRIVKLLPESQTYEIQDFGSPSDCLPKVFRHLTLKQIDSNKVIRIGGKQFDDENHIEDNVYYILDTNSMKWNKQMKRKLFSRIHSFSGISLNLNVLLINGGLNCDTNAFTSNSLNLIDGRTSDINEIKVKQINHLYSHSMKLFDENKVLIIGGMAKTGPNNRIDLLDLRSNKVIDSFDIKTESTSMLTNFTSELVLSEESPVLWLIGGGGNCFSFGTHFNELSLIDGKDFLDNIY